MTDIVNPHWMLLPAMGCPAACAYCFGPNSGGVMDRRTFESALDWIETISDGQKVSLTFHGGEPLLAGYDWYAYALPRLQQRFGGRLALSMQSNLWLLDDALCELLAEHRVSLGASLDGPEEINDAQRGNGYFKRTMAGIDTARRHGMDVGVICTFTRLSAKHYRRVFDFFAGAGLSFSVHAAVASIGKQPDGLSLIPQEYGDLLVNLFDLYLQNLSRVSISTFDQMARGVSAGEGGICVFGKCLGHYLALGADGWITPCNRFAWHEDWRMAALTEAPSMSRLQASAAWQKMSGRLELVRQACAECPYFDICGGGCIYNATLAGGEVDPLCPAYRRIFEHITDRALEQVFSDENMSAVVNGQTGRGLLRKGSLLQIMRGGVHPRQMQARALEAVASVALAESGSPQAALGRLSELGLVTDEKTALQRLEALQRRLQTPGEHWGDAYLHVACDCNPPGNHFCAESQPDEKKQTITMPLETTMQIAAELVDAGFTRLFFAGGEPLQHPQRDDLLRVLADLRKMHPGTAFVLRTNLVEPLNDEMLRLLAESVDIVVRLDGDEETHDSRRTAGTYRSTLANLRSLAPLMKQNSLSLLAVLSEEGRNGPPGESLRCIGRELGLKVRFKPLLPLEGTGTEHQQMEFDSSLCESIDELELIPRPVASCGLGNNLYIAPDGACYPCHAMMQHPLGNLLHDGVQGVLHNARSMRAFTVDSNRACRDCRLRYLCGGFCRAWGSSPDPDMPPENCSALYQRASFLLDWASDELGISGL